MLVVTILLFQGDPSTGSGRRRKKFFQGELSTSSGRREEGSFMGNFRQAQDDKRRAKGKNKKQKIKVWWIVCLFKFCSAE